jgi:hypothetical protein
MASLKLNRWLKNLSMCVKKLKKTTLEVSLVNFDLYTQFLLWNHGSRATHQPSAANGNHTPGKSIVDCRLQDFFPLDPQCYSPREDCCCQLRVGRWLDFLIHFLIKEIVLKFRAIRLGEYWVKFQFLVPALKLIVQTYPFSNVNTVAR